MPEKITYQTNPRKYILRFLEDNRGKALSAVEIYRHLCETGHELNQTTVYRYLNTLTKQGLVMKYSDDSSRTALFQYAGEDLHCDEHLHLKCISCDAIFHLDCGFMKEIARHIEAEHGFELQCKNSILYGLCENCREKQKSEKTAGS